MTLEDLIKQNARRRHVSKTTIMEKLKAGNHRGLSDELIAAYSPAAPVLPTPTPTVTSDPED